MDANPFTNPKAYDTIELDGVETPFCELVDGGDRSHTWEAQKSPGYAGAYSVSRGENISTVSYRFVALNRAEYEALKTFINGLRIGQKKRPPKTWRITDLALESTEIRDVAVESISPYQQEKGKQKWSVVVKFFEYKKRIPMGGRVKPPEKDELDTAIEQMTAENKALQSQLDAMNVQAQGDGKR